MNEDRPNDVIDLRNTQRSPEAPQETGTITPKRSEEKPTEATLLSWDALEFRQQKKDRRTWTNATLIFAGIFLIIFLLSKNFLGAVVVVLGALAVLLQAFKEPRMIHFAVTVRGITVGAKLYPLEEIKSFWIFYDPPQVKEVSFRLKRVFLPFLIIPLDAVDPVRLKKILGQFIEEVEETPSALDQFMQQMGF